MRLPRVPLMLPLVLAVVGSQRAAGDEPAQRVLRIDCAVHEIAPDGEKTTLAAPQLIVPAGKPAVVEVASETTILIDEGRAITISDGIKLELTAYCLASGQVKLDLVCSISVPVKDKAEGILSRTSTVHLLRTVPWGKQVAVPLAECAEGKTHSLELRVTEYSSPPGEDAPGR